MAEEGTAPLGPLAGIDRRILLAASVGVVLTFILLFFLFRGCRFEFRRPPLSVIYTNLELQETSKIVTLLKDLKIPYEIRDEGKAIAVPKTKADEARLGLAEKGLPKGGTVGWEIFDQSKLGATDFDRRIQFIRAISGELGRTIRSLSTIEDARVQIVIPESRLFEIAKAPVTASVLLKRRPGKTLTLSQVNGIVHLVASSVENLKPENVTVVDIEGHILAPRSVATMMLPEAPAEAVVAKAPEEKVVSVEAAGPTAEAVAIVTSRAPSPASATFAPAPAGPSSAELLLQARKEFDEKLTRRAQLALIHLYPPQKASVHISTEIESDPGHRGEWRIRKLSAAIAVDSQFDLSQALKKATFKAVAEAIEFDPRRGDRLELWRVPGIGTTVTRPGRPPGWVGGIFPYALLFVLLGGGLIWYVRVRGQPGAAELPRVEPEVAEPGLVERTRQLALQNPDRLAQLIERWLMEE